MSMMLRSDAWGFLVVVCGRSWDFFLVLQNKILYIINAKRIMLHILKITSLSSKKNKTQTILTEHREIRLRSCTNQLHF